MPLVILTLTGTGPSVFYFLGSGLAIYLFWGSAGLLGYLFGNIIPPQLNYIFDFAFVAAFLGMLVPMIKDFPGNRGGDHRGGSFDPGLYLPPGQMVYPRRYAGSEFGRIPGRLDRYR